MKTKQKTSLLKQLLVILMVTVMVAGISVVGASAADTKKTYIDTMGYSSFNSDSPRNSCSPFKGEDLHGNECTNAYQFYLDVDWRSYSNKDEVHNRGWASYNVTFKLDSKYDSFNFKLTAGNRIDQGTVNISILDDNNNLLYSNGVSENTNQIPVNFSVKGVNLLTFEIKGPLESYFAYSNNYIILNNAYFTSNGSTPEPPTDPTPGPTEPPTAPTPTPTPTPTPNTTDPTPAPTKPATPDSVINNKNGNGGSNSNGDSTVGKDGKGVVATGGVPFVTAGALATVALGAWITMLVRRKLVNK